MVKIVSDSTCDLSPELLKRYQVDILPLHICLGDEEYRDGADITPPEIYRWADAHKTTPKTSAPSIPEAVSLLRPYAEKGNEVICFAISEEMSSSAAVMRLAAQELDAGDRVFVVNSQNLSTGIGLLVIEAAVLAARGADAQTVLERIEKLKPLVRASFVVDTLVYLHRGGRCSGLSAMLGSTLKLHPQIVVSQGKMHPAKKYRGRMESVVLSYARDLEEDLKKARPERVFITHSGCERAIVDRVRDYLASLGIFEEILETRAGGVISSHCGPGTLGVLFIAGEG